MEKRDWLSVARSVLTGLVCSLLLLAAGNFLALKSPHPDRLLALLAYIALTGGAVICGVVQSRGSGHWGMSALTGALYSAVLLAVSLIAGGISGFWIRAAVYLAEGVIVLLIAHFLPTGAGSSRSGAHRGKKAAYRYLDKT